jgi:outer membrane protein OmpA-like peptidoglycan-associated protein
MRFESLSARRFLCILAALAIGAGCSSTSKKGAAAGGATGAVIGAVIGNQGDRTGTGAVVGGAIGAAAGAIIGDYMAKQKKELEQIPGAEVVQEGEELKVNFQSAILFDTDSYQLKPSSRDELQQMAQVLGKYPETQLVVVGHTDNTGSDAYNQKLSEQRAFAVKDFLVAYGVDAPRLAARGLGETAPVAANETPEGRQENRRVEVQIAANEALKEKAVEQAQQQQQQK